MGHLCRLIAGTYTPLCMLALDHATATRLLCIEWGAAFLGMVRPCFAGPEQQGFGRPRSGRPLHAAGAVLCIVASVLWALPPACDW